MRMSTQQLRYFPTISIDISKLTEIQDAISSKTNDFTETEPWQINPLRFQFPQLPKILKSWNRQFSAIGIATSVTLATVSYSISGSPFGRQRWNRKPLTLKIKSPERIAINNR